MQYEYILTNNILINQVVMMWTLFFVFNFSINFMLCQGVLMGEVLPKHPFPTNIINFLFYSFYEGNNSYFFYEGTNIINYFLGQF